MRKHYKTLMDRIEVTDAMQARILKNLAAADGAKTRARPKVCLWLPAAACLLLCIGLSVPFLKQMPQEPPHPSRQDRPPVTGFHRGETVSTPEALSEAVGFSVSEPASLPFVPESVTYVSLFGTTAEITYTRGTQTAVFRQSAGDADNSGDYTDYPYETTVSFSAGDVTLKGREEDRYVLGLWTCGGFAFSLRIAEGQSAAFWTEQMLSGNPS